MKSAQIIFWVLFAVVFYTYIGYGVLVFILAKLKNLLTPKGSEAVDFEWPEVTLLIAAYNEEAVVKEKMENSLSLEAPPGKLKIVWVTDGSDDSTNSLLEAYGGVTVLWEPARLGKTSALNRAIHFVESPIVVFTDANTMLNKEAISEIVKCFLDPKVGCVAGEKRVGNSSGGSASGDGEGLYWKYESFLKEQDSNLFTAVGAAGELFAIRRELFVEMKRDTLLDDFVLSMEVAGRGYKIAYCSKAWALESGSLNMNEERKRKIRIAAGGIQAVWRLRRLLNPFKYPLLSFQFFSHRVLRWSITPVALFLLFPLNIILAAAGDPFYRFLFTLQGLFYVAAYAGRSFENKNISAGPFMVPYYFIFMNINVLRGYIYLFKKRGDGTWERAKRANSQ